MIIQSGAFCTAIDYLAEFGDEESSIVFTPRGGIVHLEVFGENCYGKYTLRVTDSDHERFAVNLHALHEASKQLDDAPVELLAASSAKLTCAGETWWIPYQDLPNHSAPKVKVRSTATWGHELTRHIQLMSVAMNSFQDNACLDCILIDQRAQRQSVVATNGQILVAYSERNKEKMRAPRSILLERKHVAKFAKLCESESTVEISIGLTNFSVRCGRRFAIFDLRKGRFPRWEDWFSRAKSITSNLANSTGAFTTTKEEINSACRQLPVGEQVVEVVSHLNGVRLTTHQREHQEHALVSSEIINHFGPISIRADYLVKLAQNWPYPNIQVQYQQANEPIVLSSPQSNANLLALIMPVA